MNTTEEEAKNKLCPYGFDPSCGMAARCVASDCMAWRWADKKPDILDLGTTYRETVRFAEYAGAVKQWDAGPEPEGDGWEFRPFNQVTSELAKWVRAEESIAPLFRKGFCGRVGE